MDGSVAQGGPATRLSRPTDGLLGRFPAFAVGAGLVALAALVYWWSGPVRYYNHFVWQALAFLDGRAAIDWPVGPSAGSAGNAFFQDVYPLQGPDGGPTGLALIPFPPLPALVLLPFVALWGLATDERAVSVLIGAVDVGLAWWTLGRLRISTSVRLATTLFFAFGTAFWYAAQLGTTWFLAHVVALAPALLAVGLLLGADRAADDDHPGSDPSLSSGAEAAWHGSRRDSLRAALAAWRSHPDGPIDRRQFLAGLLFGVACTARLTMVFGAPFLMLVGSGGSLVRRSASAGLGAAVPLLCLVSYNLWATGHLFNPAYEYLYQLEAYGWPGLNYNPDWAIEDIRYLPQNLAIMFLSLPAILPDRIVGALGPGAPLCVETAARGLFSEACPLLLPRDVGMSILLTSPAYLLALPTLERFRRSRLVAGAAVAVAAIAVVNLMHFSQGWVQFGYRFSNDFAPFILPLVALGISRRGGVGLLAGWLIGISAAVNYWGVTWGNLLGW